MISLNANINIYATTLAELAQVSAALAGLPFVSADMEFGQLNGVNQAQNAYSGLGAGTFGQAQPTVFGAPREEAEAAMANAEEYDAAAEPQVAATQDAEPAKRGRGRPKKDVAESATGVVSGLPEGAVVTGDLAHNEAALRAKQAADARQTETPADTGGATGTAVPTMDVLTALLRQAIEKTSAAKQSPTVIRDALLAATGKGGLRELSGDEDMRKAYTALSGLL